VARDKNLWPAKLVSHLRTTFAWTAFRSEFVLCVPERYGWNSGKGLNRCCSNFSRSLSGRLVTYACCQCCNHACQRVIGTLSMQKHRKDARLHVTPVWFSSSSSNMPVPHYRIAPRKVSPRRTIYRQKSASPGPARAGGFLPVNCWRGKDFYRGDPIMRKTFYGAGNNLIRRTHINFVTISHPADFSRGRHFNVTPAWPLHT